MRTCRFEIASLCHQSFSPKERMNSSKQQISVPLESFTKVVRRQTFEDYTGNWNWLSVNLSLLYLSDFTWQEAPISHFLTHFPMDFDVGFLDRFRWRISCTRRLPYIGGGLTCKDRWSAVLRRIFMTNNSPPAISNACYCALCCNNFDP